MLIINDGSTDETLNIIEDFADKRIRVIHHAENMGRPFARNTALNEAQGQYIVWMDADDISVPNRVELQVNFMQSNDLALCGGYMQCFGQSDHLVRAKVSHDAIRAGILFYSSLLNCTSCMHLERLHKYGLKFHSELLRAQDYAFIAEALLKTPLRAGNLNQVLLNYRYFKRKTTAIYHAKAVKYILQALNLPSDEESCYKHTTLSIGQHEDIPIVSAFELIHWANQVYEQVVEKQDVNITEFLRVCHAKIESFFSTVTNPRMILREYATLPLSKTHNIAKLFSQYVK